VSVDAFRVSAHTQQREMTGSLWSGLQILWCKLTHRAPMQPVRGYVVPRLSAHISGPWGGGEGAPAPSPMALLNNKAGGNAVVSFLVVNTEKVTGRHGAEWPVNVIALLHQVCSYNQFCYCPEVDGFHGTRTRDPLLKRQNSSRA
jgi:hypothetical protein